MKNNASLSVGLMSISTEEGVNVCFIIGLDQLDMDRGWRAQKNFKRETELYIHKSVVIVCDVIPRSRTCFISLICISKKLA